MTIAERLLYARKQKGFTQETLANEIGVSRGVIFNIEKQLIKDEPQPIVISAICNALGINKEWLLKGVGPMEPADESAALLAELHKECATLSVAEIKCLLNTIRVMKQFETDFRLEASPQKTTELDSAISNADARRRMQVQKHKEQSL